MRKRRASKPAAQDWTDVVDEAPRADLPDDRDAKRQRRLRRYVMFASWAIVPALLVNAVIITNLNPNDQDTGEIITVTDYDSATARAVAVQAVTDWLDGEPAPLPGGQVVSWNFAHPVAPVNADDAGDETVIRHTHDVTLASGSLLFTAQVTVTSHPEYGVKADSTPSLMPSPPSTDESFDGPPWPGAERMNVGASVERAVHAWAAAFGGNDPNELRRVVGDPSADHAYLPLVGAQVTQARVEFVSVQAEELTSEGGLPDEPEQVIARVSLDLLWPTEDGETDSEDSDGDESSPASVVTYDVLIDRASTASPQVVAWGGPGTGPDLVMYGNAVTGRDLVIATPRDIELLAPEDTAGDLAEVEDQDVDDE